MYWSGFLLYYSKRKFGPSFIEKNPKNVGALVGLCHIYTYIYAFSYVRKWGVFFSDAFEHVPGHAFENGVRNARWRELPIFTVFRGFLKRNSYCKSPDKYAASSQGNMLTMRHLPTAISDCHLWTRTLASGESEVRSCRSRADMPRTVGENGFFRFTVLKWRCKTPKPGTSKNGKIYLCWRAPPHFCVFWWRAWISPKSGLSKWTNFRWNHCKRSAKLSCTGDSQRDSHESFAIETPIFVARQADSHESLEFPIRANHPIRANRANRFARITPLRCQTAEAAKPIFAR